jgi:hypothetical protein
VAVHGDISGQCGGEKILSGPARPHFSSAIYPMGDHEKEGLVFFLFLFFFVSTQQLELCHQSLLLLDYFWVGIHVFAWANLGP